MYILPICSYNIRMCGINDDVSCLTLTGFSTRFGIVGDTEILSILVDTRRRYLPSQRLLRFLEMICPSSLPLQSHNKKGRYEK
jgi:hypothetical protein